MKGCWNSCISTRDLIFFFQKWLIWIQWHCTKDISNVFRKVFPFIRFNYRLSFPEFSLNLSENSITLLISFYASAFNISQALYVTHRSQTFEIVLPPYQSMFFNDMTLFTGIELQIKTITASHMFLIYLHPFEIQYFLINVGASLCQSSRALWGYPIFYVPKTCVNRRFCFFSAYFSSAKSNHKL